ncbi:protein-tyrosine phosphatase-like protein [Aspergillus granulosus]|uniref:protein-tyrosine-phosphatase n=1 Tax=Aspergillus granulosus TaxID=176169 RepID=A0ABR4HCU3_9EURO
MDPRTTTTTLCPILAVPGLYISDRFAARSNPLLIEHGITHILSIVRWEDLPRAPAYGAGAETNTDPNKDPATGAQSIIRKHVDLDDDPTEDLLAQLESMLEWVHDAIGPAPLNKDAKSGRASERVREKDTIIPGRGRGRGRVLVHCNQGISRSGSVIVAYIMKYLSLPYAAALSTARESRGLIGPNIGFEYQLRMWEGCGFDVFLKEEETQNQEQDASQEGEQRQRKEKPEYAAWKGEVVQVYNHQHYQDFQRAKEEWIQSLVVRLGVLGKDDA